MDRFIAGWVSGLIAGVLMNAWSFLSFHVLSLTEHMIIDWTGGMIYGKAPESILEIFVALLLNFLFAGFLGGVFAMVIFHIGSDFLYLKGIIIATMFAFTFFTIPTLFQEPMFKKVAVNSVISNYIGATIWGIAAARILKWIDKREHIKA